MTDNMIKAEIVADSLNPRGIRLTTFVLNFPRIILAEFNTHRVFSRNSASSRAIPFETMLGMVKNNPFIPFKFQKDHKGMQGTEYFEGIEHEQCVKDWLAARDAAVNAATNFKFPITKQLRNRLLEPFLWHRVIVTSSDFENFFALRAHKDAEIHIERLAYCMLEEYNKSKPKKLEIGEWHIPFGDNIDLDRAKNLIQLEINKQEKKGLFTRYLCEREIRKKIAIARCARISYFNYEGKDDYESDIRTCDKLFGAVPKHLSPTEHVACAMNDSNFYGNFKGFKQYRKYFKDENLKDGRIKIRYDFDLNKNYSHHYNVPSSSLLNENCGFVKQNEL
jgi:thymidylate synthase ThyX